MNATETNPKQETRCTPELVWHDHTEVTHMARYHVSASDSTLIFLMTPVGDTGTYNVEVCLAEDVGDTYRDTITSMVTFAEAQQVCIEFVQDVEQYLDGLTFPSLKMGEAFRVSRFNCNGMSQYLGTVNNLDGVLDVIGSDSLSELNVAEMA